MTKKTRKKLLRFVTNGEDILRDFNESREEKLRVFRRNSVICTVFHAIFAAGCAFSGRWIGLDYAFEAVSGAAIITTLLMIIPKAPAKIIVYILDLLCAAALCAAGVWFGIRACFLCGAFMLAASIAALLAGSDLAKIRFLKRFDPTELTPNDYVQIKRFSEPSAPAKPAVANPPADENDMQNIARQFSQILNQTPSDRTGGAE